MHLGSSFECRTSSRLPCLRQPSLMTQVDPNWPPSKLAPSVSWQVTTKQSKIPGHACQLYAWCALLQSSILGFARAAQNGTLVGHAAHG